MYIHTYIHTYRYRYRHICIYVYIYMCAGHRVLPPVPNGMVPLAWRGEFKSEDQRNITAVHTYLHTYACVCMHMHAYAFICIHKHAYASIYMHMRANACMDADMYEEDCFPLGVRDPSPWAIHTYTFPYM